MTLLLTMLIAEVFSDRREMEYMLSTESKAELEILESGDNGGKGLFDYLRSKITPWQR